MSWNQYALPVLFAGIVLSAALAQTPTSHPSARSQSSAQGNRTAMATPRLHTPGTSVPIVTGVPRATVPGTRPTTRGTTPTNRREPCWQVAGVPKSAMEQRRILARQTRQEVESVCANASLSAAQKQQRIREIHQQERQQMDALITPQQQAAMRACQQERGGGVHVGGGHSGGHGLGPCGNLPGLASRENESERNAASPQD